LPILMRRFFNEQKNKSQSQELGKYALMVQKLEFEVPFLRTSCVLSSV